MKTWFAKFQEDGRVDAIQQEQKEQEARRILGERRQGGSAGADPVKIELMALTDVYERLSILMPSSRIRVLNYVNSVFSDRV